MHTSDESEGEEITRVSLTSDPRAQFVAELAKKHATWLRTLCKSLVRAEAEADELVEETFHVAVNEIDVEHLTKNVDGAIPIEVTLMQIAKRLSERHSIVPQATVTGEAIAETPKLNAPRSDASKNDASKNDASKNDVSKAATPKATPQTIASSPTWNASRALAWTLAGATALAILTAIVWTQENRPDDPSAVPFGALGRVTQITRSSTQTNTNESGLTAQTGSSSPQAVSSGSALGEDVVLRTDARTRARVELRDGSHIVLNRNTEVALFAAHPRQFELHRGEIVADIAHMEDDERALITTPAGEIEVIGTQFVLAANNDMANVRVVRGAVNARSGGASVPVKAGEEGVLAKTRAPSVSPSVGLAAAMAWSDMTPDGNEPDAPIPGLGELRARRPGERGEGERPLRLVTHEVDVNIQGAFARTDIVEVFRNDTDHTLEGIYRFPLPSDASIAGLSLDIDGHMQSGVFVDSQEASRIWNGVIRHATPHPVNMPHEEWVWVPGPWRDPALLQWQRGGRFELRVFPIPAHGERRIAIHYTQVVNAHADRRSYTYPLPHGANASTRAEHFKLDAHIGGASDVNVGGYDVHAEDRGEAFELHFAADSFEPAGDLVLDYKLSGDASELRSFAYRPASTNASDTAGFVAFALRPNLPASTSSTARDYAIVVDSSQSMYGERYARATSLVSRIVGNLDRTDRVLLLACDTSCAAMEEAPSYASAELATRSIDFLRARRPAGASDLVGAFERASSALHRANNETGRALHVLYVGDGVSTIGERRVGSIVREVDSLARRDHVAFNTVGIGSDSDPLVLGEIARVGGGHYIPYVPGERVSSAALAVLETTYGRTLHTAHIEWPSCLRDAAPTVLPNLRAGEEIILTARVDCDVDAQITLRGKVGGEEFVQHYPVRIHPTANEGNAFVPRLWARAKIAELERQDRNEDRASIVELSKSYFVMSRHTSLLVLESEAMFRAFGVDHAQNQFEWSGADEADGELSTGTEAIAEPEATPTEALGGLGFASAASGDVARNAAGPAASAPAQRQSMEFSDRSSATVENESRSRGTGRAGARGEAANSGADLDDQLAVQGSTERRIAPAQPGPDHWAAQPHVTTVPTRPVVPQRPPGGQWMRRVWRTVREGNVNSNGAPSASELRALAVSEDALHAAPDARDRYRNATRAAARVGDLDRARALAETWLGRDALDPEALTYLADAIGRSGSRDESLRLLTGVVDLRPDDRTLQERLFAAFRRADDHARACAFRIALDEIERLDVNRPRSSRCSELESSAPESMSGDLRVDANWSAPVDLDISLITPQGTRLSWMGGRTQVFGRDAHADGHETLGLRRATAGSYIIEVSRTSSDEEGKSGGCGSVRGTVNVTVLGQRRTLSFDLSGERTVVGRADVVVRRYSELVRF